MVRVQAISLVHLVLGSTLGTVVYSYAEYYLFSHSLRTIAVFWLLIVYMWHLLPPSRQRIPIQSNMFSARLPLTVRSRFILIHEGIHWGGAPKSL